MDAPGIPRLKILRRQGDAWTALVPGHHWVGEDHVCRLALDDGRGVWARFLSIDRPRSQALVRPDDAACLVWLGAGDSCAFFDGYYGERVELVMGAPRHWFPLRYVPADPAADGTPRVGTWSAAGQGTGARRVAEGASDHEHCSICWSKVGHGGEGLGYVSEQGEWICLACHRDWILPRSIGFALDWAGGARNPDPTS